MTKRQSSHHASKLHWNRNGILDEFERVCDGDMQIVVNIRNFTYVCNNRCLSQTNTNPSRAYAMNTSAILEARYIINQAIINGTLTINIERRRPNESAGSQFGNFIYFRSFRSWKKRVNIFIPVMKAEKAQPSGSSTYAMLPELKEQFPKIFFLINWIFFPGIFWNKKTSVQAVYLAMTIDPLVTTTSHFGCARFDSCQLMLE